jgi:hydroxymethylbilane synthase
VAWPDLECDIRPFPPKDPQQIGDNKNLLTELENALCNGNIDIAVHTLNELPIEQPTGIVLGAIVDRADARDALVPREADLQLGSLPIGATVGSSSLLRRVQLLESRPDLRIKPIDGTIEAQLNKLKNGDYDAIILAVADLKRLELQAHISQILPLSLLLPAPGQGVLAVQCRQADLETRQLLDKIHRADVEQCITAERTLLRILDDGKIPVGAFAVFEANMFYMLAAAGTANGAQIVRVKGKGIDPVLLAEQLADELAHSKN